MRSHARNSRNRGKTCLIGDWLRTMLSVLPDTIAVFSPHYGSYAILTLLTNCRELLGPSDLSWLPPTQECGFREFANSIRSFLR